MRRLILPRPIIVVLMGVVLALAGAGTAHAMLKRDAVKKHNIWQHTACDAGNRTCISPQLVATVCHGPIPGSTGPHVGSAVPQYSCVGHMAMRTGSTGWACVVFTDWSQYGNFIEGKIVCTESTS